MDEIREQLSQGIYQIIENAYNSGIELINKNDDIILIKIAERLHNLRTIEFIDEFNDLSMKYYVK